MILGMGSKAHPFTQAGVSKTRKSTCQGVLRHLSTSKMRKPMCQDVFRHPGGGLEPRKLTCCQQRVFRKKKNLRYQGMGSIAHPLLLSVSLCPSRPFRP